MSDRQTRRSAVGHRSHPGKYPERAGRNVRFNVTIKHNIMQTATDFSLVFEVDNPSNAVYTAINNVTGWWTENMEGSSKRIGDTFTVTFSETYITLRVAEQRTNFRIAWEVIDCHKHFLQNPKEWVGTTVCFDIEQVNYVGSRVRFTHVGLVEPLACYDICSDAWGRYLLGSLKALITTGKGYPDQKE